MFRIISLVVLAGYVFTSTVSAEDARIKYPSDYKQSFTNYLSLDRTQNDDQIIRLFANDIALKGVRETGEFPDGSILVGEIYKAKKDSSDGVIASKLGRRIRDNLALIAVMQKEKGWGEKFPDGLKNADWDFAAFKPDGAVADKDLNQCRTCHSPLTDSRHVFSYEHIK